MKHLFTFFFCLTCFLITRATGQTVAISEIQYDPDSTMKSEDWVELHNYGTESIDLGGWKLKDEAENSYTIPVETNLGAGEFLVLAQDKVLFSAVYPDVLNVIGPFGFGLNNLAGSVILYDDGGDVVRQVNYIDSLPWPNGADGLGPSLEIVDYEADENDPSNWIAGCVGGSPGIAYADCDYDLVVSEVNYNSAGAFEMGEWIELWNKSDAPINLSGWIIKDNNDDNLFTIPDGYSLNPNERIVISDSLEAMSVLFPGVTNIIGEFTFGLSNNGDAIRIYNDQEVIQYSIRYDDELPWPTDADGEGFTMELYVDGNPNIASNWVAGCPFGSPGKEFILPCPTGIDEIGIDQSIWASPNPFTNSVVVRLPEHLSGQPITVSIKNSFGRYVIDFPATGAVYWDGRDMNGVELPGGMYLLQVMTSSGEVHTTRLIKF